MVSVCLAVKNGEAYLEEQINSILSQLAEGDELIISNDHSIDSTRKIIDGYRDSRILVLESLEYGVMANFENCLNHAKGDFIFLSDQDDVWLPNKISLMTGHLNRYDLVVSDCALADHRLQVQSASFFKANRSGPGVLKNLWRNSYMGCCMAFRKKVLTKALPFPKGLPVHDLWIGLIAEFFFTTTFAREVLLLHRRHEQNASTTGNKSEYSLFQRINYRVRVLNNLLHLKYV